MDHWSQYKTTFIYLKYVLLIMYIMKDVFLDTKMEFETIYQISKYLFEHGISKTLFTNGYIKKSIAKKQVIYKHYFVQEVPNHE